MLDTFQKYKQTTFETTISDLQTSFLCIYPPTWRTKECNCKYAHMWKEIAMRANCELHCGIVLRRIVLHPAGGLFTAQCPVAHTSPPRPTRATGCSFIHRAQFLLLLSSQEQNIRNTGLKACCTLPRGCEGGMRCNGGGEQLAMKRHSHIKITIGRGARWRVHFYNFEPNTTSISTLGTTTTTHKETLRIEWNVF